jgi:hypothetical protein
VTKRLMAILFVCVMTLSFAVPVMAHEAVMVQPTNVVVESVSATAEQEVSPFHEFTRIYWRWSNGVLQFRVWSMTNAIWLTEWADF